MKTPNFEEFFDRFRRDTRVASGAELGRLMGLTRGTVSHAKRNNMVPPEWIYRLAEKGYNTDWLLYGKGKPFQKSDPLFDNQSFVEVPKVRAKLDESRKTFSVMQEGIESWYAFRKYWIDSKGRFKDMFLIEVSGTAMAPLMSPGTHLLVDTGKKEPVDGGYFAVAFNGTVVVKQLFLSPGKCRLKSENSEIEDVYGKIDEDFIIVGQVIWRCTEML